MTTDITSGVDYVVDLNRMVSFMKREIDHWESFSDHTANRTCTIHKVPQHIRELDRNSYDPIVLSIGPYHHGVQAALSMEKEKWKSLDFILKLNCRISLKEYIKAVAEIEQQARNCYPEDIKMSRKQFVQMLLLDSCFILVKVDGTVLSAMPKTKSPRLNDIEGSDNATVQNTGARTDRVSDCGTYIGNTSVENVAVDEIIEAGDQMEKATVSQIESGVENVGADDIIEVEDQMEKATVSQIESGNSSTREHDCCQQYDEGTTGDWYSNCAWHDLFLLENQIPFFVVNSIYTLALGKSMPKRFEDSIIECVGDILQHFPKAAQKSDISKKVHNFLHLSHIYLRPSKNIEAEEMSIYRFLQFGKEAEENRQRLLPVQQMDCFRAGRLPSIWRRASQYHEAGISLQKREYADNNKHSLLDITFRNGIVEFPCFPIDENTESFFKNLIAFEQTDPSFGDDITAYIAFMSHLTRTCEDSSLLVQKGVIVHMLDSDDEVSALLTRLTKEVTFNSESDYYLKPLCLILEAHYQSRLNRWVAWLWLNHFSNPWLALAVLATGIMLVCTVVQTIYTVLAYVKPQK